MQLPSKIKACCFFLLLLLGAAFGDAISFNPSELGVGARPLALGKAFVALADDASAIFVNPAGLSSSNNLQVISMYSSLLESQTYLTLGASNNYHFGTLGIGYINVALPNIEVYEFVGGWPTVVGYASYNSSVLFVSYSKKMRENLQVGGSLKFFSQGFSGGGASYESVSGSGMDADVGIKYIPSQWLSLGISAQNFLPTSLLGRFTWRGDADVESIPFIFKSGLAIKILGPKALRKTKNIGLMLLFDYDYSLQTDNEYHMGFEFKPVERFALRVGFDNGNLAAGVAFPYQDFSFDYAYRKLEGAGDNVSHALSIGYFLGRTKAREEQKIADVRQKKEKKKVLIPIFTDVENGCFAREAIEKLSALGIVSGFADGTFRTEQEITRAELAMFLVRSLGIETEKIEGRVFKDIPDDHWSAPYVKIAVERGFINGYPDGTFRPNWPISRAEVVAVLSRYDNFPEDNEALSSFDDLALDHWAYEMIAVAEERGILKFIKEGDFAPDKKVTRAEIAEMLYHTQFIQSIITKKDFILHR